MTDVELKDLVASLAVSQKETDRAITRLSNLFTGQWGKLVEALIGSGLPALFQRQGIAVKEISRRHEIWEGKIRIAEIDVLLHNGTEDIGIEVKTTCRPQDVKDHIARLKKVHASVPKYSTGQKKLYGGMAALTYVSEADDFARSRGLFVLQSCDGLFSIVNEPDFVPKAW